MAAERIMEHFSRWLTTSFTVARISATTFLTPEISFTQRSSMPGSSMSSSAVPIATQTPGSPLLCNPCLSKWLAMPHQQDVIGLLDTRNPPKVEQNMHTSAGLGEGLPPHEQLPIIHIWWRAREQSILLRGLCSPTVTNGGPQGRILAFRHLFTCSPSLRVLLAPGSLHSCKEDRM